MLFCCTMYFQEEISHYLIVDKSRMQYPLLPSRFYFLIFVKILAVSSLCLCRAYSWSLRASYKNNNKDRLFTASTRALLLPTSHPRAALVSSSYLRTRKSTSIARFLSTSTMSNFEATNNNPFNFTWQQTMLRIKDPLVTVPFYTENFGFTLIHKYDFADYKFSLYFLAILPEGETFNLTPGTPESERYLWNFSGVTLELTHNHGSENDASFQVNNGNVEPYRGFGHIAVMTPDVYATSSELEANGVKFQKRPDEGRMKGIAFALCPDGYWIEIVPRSAASTVSLKYTFAQTMMRVKDPKPAVHFFTEFLGMTLLRVTHIGTGSPGGFSLYFLATLSESERAQWAELQVKYQASGEDITLSQDANEFIKCMFSPVLELTHNHGTEENETFRYHNGNDQDEGQLRGFGHVGYLVDDLQAACEHLQSQGVRFKKLPQEGTMHNIAFAYTPVDNYWVELIQRGSTVNI